MTWEWRVIPVLSLVLAARRDEEVGMVGARTTEEMKVAPRHAWACRILKGEKCDNGASSEARALDLINIDPITEEFPPDWVAGRSREKIGQAVT
jgi:hypothetical protein